MQILATICARAGSKGVKGKNVREFLGQPISYYTLSAFSLFSQRSKEKYNCTLAINTDSDELIKQVRLTNVEFLHIKRIPELAGDNASKIDVIRNTLEISERETGIDFDMVLDMDLTSPLRKIEDIFNLIDKLKSIPDADVAMTITEARRNPYFNQLTQKNDGFLKTVIDSEYVARQQSPPVYDANASLYAYRPGFLKYSDKILLKANIIGSLMDDTGILDIDNERDFFLMEAVANFLYEKDSLYGEIKNNISKIIV